MGLAVKSETLLLFPHRRGGSQAVRNHARQYQVVPAQAGVILVARIIVTKCVCCSRTGGGDPCCDER